MYDAARGADVLQSLNQAFRDAAEFAPAAALIAEAPNARALLEAAFSASPYLAALAQRTPADLAACLTRDPEAHARRRA